VSAGVCGYNVQWREWTAGGRRGYNPVIAPIDTPTE
jgi:hypothetical protein